MEFEKILSFSKSKWILLSESSLDPVLIVFVSQELWEENLSAAVMLQLLEIVEKFMAATAGQAVATDYSRLDCITSIITGFLGRSQPLPFWKAFLPVFKNLFAQHGAILMSRDNDRFLKQVAFHLLRLGVFRNESIRKRAVVGLLILVRVSFISHSCVFVVSFSCTFKSFPE